MQEKEKSNLLAVDVVVFDGEGNVLLRKREKEPDAGKWELFGGYPFLGERLEEAAKRILEKKAGTRAVASISFSGNYYDDPARHPDTSCLPLLFLAVVSKDISTSDTLRWFSYAEARALPMALDNAQIVSDAIDIFSKA